MVGHFNGEFCLLLDFIQTFVLRYSQLSTPKPYQEPSICSCCVHSPQSSFPFPSRWIHTDTLNCLVYLLLCENSCCHSFKSDCIGQRRRILLTGFGSICQIDLMLNQFDATINVRGGQINSLISLEFYQLILQFNNKKKLKTRLEIRGSGWLPCGYEHIRGCFVVWSRLVLYGSRCRSTQSFSMLECTDQPATDIDWLLY